jgi:ATP-dependent RNA helicase RhlE
MSFETLGLCQPILRAIADAGYTTPTPIQLQAIPAVLSGRDLLAGAQTGTGKTAGFTLPILQRLTDRSAALVRGTRPIRTLILTPTRELAAQVEQSVKTYGKYLPIKSTVIFGGVGQNPQVQAIRKGVDILVATPGRLLDLHQQRACDLSQIEIFVLDEADRMLDMGFVHDIKKVLAILPANPNGVRRQNLLYSATFSDDIKALADRLLDEPQLIEVARRNTTAQTISQKIHFVDRDKKRALLSKLISEGDWKQVLVFTRTKFGANRLADQLSEVGITAMAIHGNKSQGARTKALADFKAGSLRALVATDIAARGIDIDQLPYVVNYDLPNVPEDYVHRIGRTGRAGALGHAVSLVTVDETNFLSDIERLTKQQLTREVIPGFEADMSVPAEPVSTGRQTLWGAPKPRGWVAPPKVVHGRGGGGQNRGGPSRGASAWGDSKGNDSAKRGPRPEGLRAGPRPAHSPARGNASGSGFGAAQTPSRSSAQPSSAAPAKAPGQGFAPRPASGMQNRSALTGARPSGGTPPPGRSAGTGRTMSFGKLR